MDLQLSGRRALVTGGSRGIGLAVAKALTAEGVDVALAARDEQRVAAAAASLASASGRKVVGLSVDTGDDASVRAMVAAAAGALGGIDILVNSAAIPAGEAPAPKLAGVTDEIFYADVDVKVLGYLRCAREAAPFMIEQHWGRIINISGLSARRTGSIIASIRNVSVSALTANLADELGPHGINVTVVHPGVTRTERTPDSLQRQAAARGVQPADVEAALGQATSIGRIIDASEVADVVAFLASPRSVALTGDAITAGGGSRGVIYY